MLFEYKIMFNFLIDLYCVKFKRSLVLFLIIHYLHYSIDKKIRTLFAM